MKLRHLAAWFAGVALLGTGATLLLAQTPPPPRGGPAPALDLPAPVVGRAERGKLRAQIIKLRTETEILRFEYEFARDSLLEDVKMHRSMQMAGQFMGAVGGMQAALIAAQAEPEPAGAPRPAPGPALRLPQEKPSPAGAPRPDEIVPAPANEQPVQAALEAAKAVKAAAAEEKKAVQAAKAAALENKKAAEDMSKQEEMFIAEGKKELARLYALLAEKELDLEDAERLYNETPR